MEENVYTIKIGDLLALIALFERFIPLDEDIRNTFNKGTNYDALQILRKIDEKEFCFGAKPIKKFYESHRDDIDIINKTSNISNFIYNYYSGQNSFNKKYNIYYFYQYLVDNKDHFDEIIAVLKHLQDLGFTEIRLNTELDFTGKVHSISTLLNYNLSVMITDNMAIVPNYSKSTIKYHTGSSPYRIELKIYTPLGISKSSSIITLNSLVFDPDRLPKDLSEEETFGKLLRMKVEEKDDCQVVYESVSLSVSVDDLEKQASSTARIIESISDVKTKEELRIVLDELMKKVFELQNKVLEFNASIESSSITPEVLEREKKLYLDKREWDKLDLD